MGGTSSPCVYRKIADLGEFVMTTNGVRYSILDGNGFEVADVRSREEADDTMAMFNGIRR